METFSDIFLFIGNHFVNEIFISVLFLLFIGKFFKKIDIIYAQRILKWALIIYGISYTLILLHYFTLSYNSNPIFEKRITGTYKYAYWFMIIANSLLPLFLLIKKIGNNIYILLLITFFMNFGWLLESTLMHIMSKHSDPTELERYMRFLPYDRELVIILTGVIYGIITLVIGNSVKKRIT